MKSWRLTAPSSILILLRDGLSLSTLPFTLHRSFLLSCGCGRVPPDPTEPPAVYWPGTDWLLTDSSRMKHHRRSSISVMTHFWCSRLLQGVSSGCLKSDGKRDKYQMKHVEQRLCRGADSCAPSQDFSCMVLKDSLPCSQKTVTWACPKLN